MEKHMQEVQPVAFQVQTGLCCVFDLCSFFIRAASLKQIQKSTFFHLVLVELKEKNQVGRFTVFMKNERVMSRAMVNNL